MTIPKITHQDDRLGKVLIIRPIVITMTAVIITITISIIIPRATIVISAAMFIVIVTLVHLHPCKEGSGRLNNSPRRIQRSSRSKPFYKTAIGIKYIYKTKPAWSRPSGPTFAYMT